MAAEPPVHKLPPQNLEAEQCVLGAILIENEAVHRALDLVSSEDFYREAHRHIFSAMLDLSNRGEAIDLITLTEFLRREDRLERVGGAAYLAQLTELIPTAANVRYHAQIVRQKAVLRGLVQTATEIVERGYQQTDELEELLDFAERRIFAISERQVQPSFVPVKEVLKDSFAMIEKLYERQEMVTGVPTGFRDMDEMTAGFQPSDLVVVAGRPSMGKTALAMTIAQRAGIDHGQTVAVFSLEMGKEQLLTRMLCSEARVDSSKLRTGRFAKTDWPKLTTAAGRLTEAPIYIDDTAAISVLEMRSRARRLKAEKGLGLVIVDYLQLMRGRAGSDSREQEISDISRSLKALAKELKVPVIALSQLSRAVESRQDKRPMLSDLRESGAIEQDADVVMFVYREEFYKPCGCPSEGICECGRRGRAEIIIGKQRNGPTGTVKLLFRNSIVRFEDLDEVHGEASFA
ncbi:MAG: replicative DNA helicase [Nitrospirota bacterium]|nr:replicative DNA helicase [Nitrospirota bacterium]